MMCLNLRYRRRAFGTLWYTSKTCGPPKITFKFVLFVDSEEKSLAQVKTKTILNKGN